MSIKLKTYDRTKKNRLYGRFGGGWDWKLGIAVSSIKLKNWTVIIDLLFVSIRIEDISGFDEK